MQSREKDWMCTGSLSSLRSLHSSFTGLLFPEHAKLVPISVPSTRNTLPPDVHPAYFLHICSKVTSLRPSLTIHLRAMELGAVGELSRSSQEGQGESLWKSGRLPREGGKLSGVLKDE